MEGLIQKFWTKVDRKQPDDCWEWQGSFKDKDHHYGIMWFGGIKKKAHRISWELHNGPITNGLHVLHKCDNAKCVNPAHLFLGTHTDNMRDMHSKGYVRHCSGEAWRIAHEGSIIRGDASYYRRHPERVPRGEKNVRAKLTDQQAREIKLAIKEVGGRRGICKELGDKYGLPGDTIQKIKQGKNWAHISV